MFIGDQMRNKENYIARDNIGDENINSEVMLPICKLNVPTGSPVNEEIIDKDAKLDTSLPAPSPVLVSIFQHNDNDAIVPEGDEISNREDINKESDLRNIFDSEEEE